MRTLMIAAAAACLLAGPAPAQGPQSSVTHAAAIEAAVKEGIILPAASPLRFASVVRDPDPTATFSGRVEITGTYEIEVYDDEISAYLWPDERSRKLLPHWDGRGDVEHLYVSNSTEFATAVLSGQELAKLKSGRLALIRGQASIVADGYEASKGDCDSISYEARFVSIQKNVEFAGDPGDAGGC